MNDDDSVICKSESINIENHSPIPLFYQVVLNDLIFQQLKELINDANMGMNNLLNVSNILDI
jgi:hypothetical protein